MFIQSRIGRLTLLPAVPSELSHGELKGTRARGQIEVKSISWDMTAGTMQAILKSEIDQSLDLVIAPEYILKKITVNGVANKPFNMGLRKQGCAIQLSKGKAVTISAGFSR